MPSVTCPACSATLRWIRMDSGALYPVDAVPAPLTGRVAARPLPTSRTVRYVAGYVVTQRRPLRHGFVLFAPHRATCDMQRRTPAAPGPRATSAPLF